MKKTEQEAQLRAYHRLFTGLIKTLREPSLSWREKSMLLLCAYDEQYYSQETLKEMGVDGSAGVRSIIHGLLRKGLLLRKEVFHYDECQNKIGTWKNILTPEGEALLFPCIED